MTVHPTYSLIYSGPGPSPTGGLLFFYLFGIHHAFWSIERMLREQAYNLRSKFKLRTEYPEDADRVRECKVIIGLNPICLMIGDNTGSGKFRP